MDKVVNVRSPELIDAWREIQELVAQTPGATIESRDNPMKPAVGWIATLPNGERREWLISLVALKETFPHLKPETTVWFKTPEGRKHVAKLLQEGKLLEKVLL